jgi:anti-sigma factor RsiW
MIVNADDLSCQELVELVTEYLEGTLTPPARTRFEMHLCYCDWCRVYLRQMRDVTRLAGRLSEEALPAAGKEALLRAFRGWKRSAGEEP